MQTHQLKRTHPNTKRMIVARGGKRGKTAGRGGKGQSARAGNKRRPEWRDIIKKIPKLRGRGVNSFKPYGLRPEVINVSVLESTFSSGDSITPTTIVEKGILNTLSGRIPDVKILGDGEVTKSFKISGCFVSMSAKEKIEKAGGNVVLMAKQEEAITSKAEAKVPKKEVVNDEPVAKADKPAKAVKKTVEKEKNEVKKVDKKSVKK